MTVTKLDAYDYAIYPGIIRIRLEGTNDPDSVDIMSELSRTDGNIYIEGRRFIYLGKWRIYPSGKWAFIELDVEEVV